MPVAITAAGAERLPRPPRIAFVAPLPPASPTPLPGRELRRHPRGLPLVSDQEISSSGSPCSACSSRRRRVVRKVYVVRVWRGSTAKWEHVTQVKDDDDDVLS
ncbi:hypothetical protein CGRA01v4_07095 [Colletotrichum graminicola]|nr:hypothetical protein CGRA01v4_07095 [Colletotrichum graminicola]